MIETPTGGELYYQGQARSNTIRHARRNCGGSEKFRLCFQNPYGSLNPRKESGANSEEPLLINTVPSLSKAQRREKRHSDDGGKVGLAPALQPLYPP